LNVPVVRLRHPIDTERFAPVGDIAERPRRALVLSNYLSGARRRALVEAWEGAGVECVQVGDPTSMALDVVPDIGNADIVVGKGRVALEGMSCARAVYVYDTYAGDGWVTPENYAALEADNFAGFATDGPRTATDLAGDIASYSADMGWTNREIVKAHHSARRHTIALLDVLRSPEPRTRRRVEGLAEITRLSRLSWDAERRAMVLQAETDALRARLDRVEAELSATHATHAEFVAAVGARMAEKDADMTAASAELERQLEEARRVLATRRARVGLAVGRAIDRMRGVR
jgi:uncharacterized membrane-anchored protein YhcB (DUF1043 family)